MQQNFQDSITVCKEYGHHDLFITLIYNPKWVEIQRSVIASGSQDASVCPELVARVFKMKLDSMMSDLTKKDFIGRVLAGCAIKLVPLCGPMISFLNLRLFTLPKLLQHMWISCPSLLIFPSFKYIVVMFEFDAYSYYMSWSCSDDILSLSLCLYRVKWADIVLSISKNLDIKSKNST